MSECHYYNNYNIISSVFFQLVSVFPTLYRVQIVDLGLEDPTAAAKGENLGFIRLFVQVTMVTEGDSHDDKRTAGTKPSKSIQVWNGLVTVLLVEGTNLPSMDSNGEDNYTVGTSVNNHL